MVGGALDELVTLRDSLRASGIKGVFVDVPFAQHTSAINPISSGLTKLAQSVTISAPSIPMVSTLHGRLVPAGDDSVFDASYFFRHSAEPVQFEGGINDLHQVKWLKETAKARRVQLQHFQTGQIQAHRPFIFQQIC